MTENGNAIKTSEFDKKFNNDRLWGSILFLTSKTSNIIEIGDEIAKIYPKIRTGLAYYNGILRKSHSQLFS